MWITFPSPNRGRSFAAKNRVDHHDHGHDCGQPEDPVASPAPSFPAICSQAHGVGVNTENRGTASEELRLRARRSRWTKKLSAHACSVGVQTESRGGNLEALRDEI